VRELYSRISQAVTQCRQRSVYDHEHRTAADAFAPVYDQEEQKKCATIAYYHFENQLIRETINRLVQNLSKRARRRLTVLDLGCGTGRIEACLAGMECRGQLEVAAVDFSGAMLREAYKKLGGLTERCELAFGYPLEHHDDGKLHVSLYRAPAENIHALKARYSDGFDLAVLGFGLLSYVRSSQVLPFAVQAKPTMGIWALLRAEGELLFSVYNEDSIVYDTVKLNRDYAQDCPIAAIMELEAGRLKVGENRYFECEAFTLARMSRFLSQAGFDVEESRIETFPTLHLALKNSHSGTFQPHPEFPYGRFDNDLYEYDRRLSMMFRDRGHYLVGVAVKKVL
jgi:SAM-dependent methyltransferase